jgi:hypothetical protein
VKFSLVSDWFADFGHAQWKRLAHDSDGNLFFWAWVAFLLLLFLSWQLLLILAIGLLVTGLTYAVQTHPTQWRSRLSRLSAPWLNTAVGRAIALGVASSLGVAGLFWIWMATGRLWIAASFFLQGFMAFGLFSLWWQRQPLPQAPHPSLSNPDQEWERYSRDLAHSNPMRRLIAIRRLQSQAIAYPLSALQWRELEDYCRMMLSQESDPLLRLAVQDVLESTSPKRLDRRSAAIEIPAKPSGRSLSKLFLSPLYKTGLSR